MPDGTGITCIALWAECGVQPSGRHMISRGRQATGRAPFRHIANRATQISADLENNSCLREDLEHFYKLAHSGKKQSYDYSDYTQRDYHPKEFSS